MRDIPLLVPKIPIDLLVVSHYQTHPEIASRFLYVLVDIAGRSAVSFKTKEIAAPYRGRVNYLEGNFNYCVNRSRTPEQNSSRPQTQKTEFICCGDTAKQRCHNVQFY